MFSEDGSWNGSLIYTVKSPGSCVCVYPLRNFLRFILRFSSHLFQRACVIFRIKTSTFSNWGCGESRSRTAEIEVAFFFLKNTSKKVKSVQSTLEEWGVVCLYSLCCVCTCCVCMDERDQCAWCLGSGFSGVGDEEEKIF